MKNHKIIDFNSYSDNSSVDNIKIYSGVKKGRKYKLLRKVFPYIAVSSLFLGIMHFLGGYSIDDGNIMMETSYSYGSDDFSDLDGKQELVYYGSWEKDNGSYYRNVNRYDAQYFSSDHILDLLKNKDNSVSVLDDYILSSKREVKDDIPLKDKFLKDSSMYYYSYYYSGYDEKANLGLSGLFDPLTMYAFCQIVILFIYKRTVENRLFDDDKIIDLNQRKKIRRK